LRRLWLDATRFKGIHAKYSWLKKREGVYKRPTTSYPWPFLHRVAEHFKADCRVQQDILCAMGLKDYGFIDCDLADLFLSIPEDIPFELAREQVIDRIVIEIIEAINQERATTGLNIMGLSGQHSEIAKRMHQIVELREKEMRQVIVGASKTEVDLRELYLTAYGYNILTTLGIPPTANHEDLKLVKKTLSELGFKLRTGKTSTSDVRMSDKLKQTIWWIVQNRNIPWWKIKD